MTSSNQTNQSEPSEVTTAALSAPKTELQDSVYRRFIGYMTPYWKVFALAIVGMFAIAITEPMFAAVMKPMLDGSFVEKDPQTIKYVPIVVIGIFILRGIGNFISTYCMTWVSRKVVHDMREQLFRKLLLLPTSFYDSQSAAKLTSKLIYDVEQVANASSDVVTIIIRDTLTIIGLLAWMFYLNWLLSILFIVLTPVMAVIVVYISRRFRRISKRIQRSMGDVTQVSQQVVEGHQVVKIYGAQKQEVGIFTGINDFNFKQHMKMALVSATSIPIVQLLAAFAIAIVIYVATNETLLAPAGLAGGDTITVGSFMSFVTAAMLIMQPMRRLTKVTASWQKGIAGAQSIFALLDQDIEQDQGGRVVDKVRGEIRFNHVSFSYNEQMDDHAQLQDIDLTVEPGTTVAIVGKSGSGKSTLVSLIPRFYNPGKGGISLDGIPLREIQLDSLRQHIALVNQEITLFNDTVANNIAYGSIDSVSREQIIAAARAAHAMEFIDGLPQGLDTQIGDKGVLLSGGQRQRLAIARALLKDAPILILDEATSALDTESERMIQQALELLIKNRTTLVIAHRLSTIEKADKILVMDEGRIVESGNHQSLIKLGGHYALLHQMQFVNNEAQ